MMAIIYQMIPQFPKSLNPQILKSLQYSTIHPNPILLINLSAC
jgi:hypothetical protein